MHRLLSALLVGLCFPLLFSTAGAQTLQAPPQLQQLVVLKTEATGSVNAILQPAQRAHVELIARAAESALNRSFGDVNASDGPLLSVFSLQQLTDLAAALRDGREPNVSEDQLSTIARYMSDIVLKAGPTWQMHAAQVDALLTPQQRDRVNAVRSYTFSRLPKFSFMGFDFFSALASGFAARGGHWNSGLVRPLARAPGNSRLHGSPEASGHAKLARGSRAKKSTSCEVLFFYWSLGKCFSECTGRRRRRC
ncbi:MAG: hypothetical protein ABR584_03845 [Candidatus Baltobacteraceae bacterium]